MKNAVSDFLYFFAIQHVCGVVQGKYVAWEFQKLKPAVKYHWVRIAECSASKLSRLQGRDQRGTYQGCGRASHLPGITLDCISTYLCQL